MATTFTWTVTRMDCFPQADGQTDVVYMVHWTCAGTDGTYQSSIYNTCAVPSPTGTFTPYADLTQDQVLGWIWAGPVDQTVTETAVQAQIDNLINPPSVSPPLPWVTP